MVNDDPRHRNGVPIFQCRQAGGAEAKSFTHYQAFKGSVLRIVLIYSSTPVARSYRCYSRLEAIASIGWRPLLLVTRSYL